MPEQHLYDEDAQKAITALCDFLGKNSARSSSYIIFSKNLQRLCEQNKPLNRKDAMMLDNNLLSEMSGCLYGLRARDDQSSEWFQTKCDNFKAIYAARQNLLLLAEKTLKEIPKEKRWLGDLCQKKHELLNELFPAQNNKKLQKQSGINKIFDNTASKLLAESGPLSYRLFHQELTAAKNGTGNISADTALLCEQGLSNQKSLLLKQEIFGDDCEILKIQQLKTSDLAKKMQEIDKVSAGFGLSKDLIKQLSTRGTIIR